MELLLPVVFVLALVEWGASGFWWPAYFRSGLLVYRKTVLLPFHLELSAEELTTRFEKGVLPPLLFRRISGDELAFRESYLCFRLLHYTPLMHGLIRYRHGRLEILGLANWFPLAFFTFFVALAFGVGGFSRFRIMFLIAPVVVYALLYFVQVVRFTKVYDFLLSKGQYAGAKRDWSVGV